MTKPNEPTEIISVFCRLCKTEHHIPVHTSDYTSWKNGALIQHVMPYLTEDQRELLISNTCGPCFDNLFPTQKVDYPTDPDPGTTFD